MEEPNRLKRELQASLCSESEKLRLDLTNLDRDNRIP